MLILVLIVLIGVLIALAVIAYGVLVTNRAIAVLTELVTSERAAIEVLNRTCDAVSAAIETTALLVEATKGLATELQTRVLTLARNGSLESSRH